MAWLKRGPIFGLYQSEVSNLVVIFDGALVFIGVVGGFMLTRQSRIERV